MASRVSEIKVPYQVNIPLELHKEIEGLGMGKTEAVITAFEEMCKRRSEITNNKEENIDRPGDVESNVTCSSCIEKDNYIETLKTEYKKFLDNQDETLNYLYSQNETLIKNYENCKIAIKKKEQEIERLKAVKESMKKIIKERESRTVFVFCLLTLLILILLIGLGYTSYKLFLH